MGWKQQAGRLLSAADTALADLETELAAPTPSALVIASKASEAEAYALQARSLLYTLVATSLNDEQAIQFVPTIAANLRTRIAGMIADGSTATEENMFTRFDHLFQISQHLSDRIEELVRQHAKNVQGT